jgi:hypothetical protein
MQSAVHPTVLSKVSEMDRLLAAAVHRNNVGEDIPVA